MTELFDKQNNNKKIRHIATAFIAVVMLLFVGSCQNKTEDLVDIIFNPDIVPTMTTDSVVTLISDSGVTRYKLIAKKWQVFDRAKEPYWFFPEGIYLERFDSLFHIEAVIYADTAWNYVNKRLWRLKGNVNAQNMKGEKFLSDELFWDQRKQRIYSDKFIEIQKGETELKGYGFESNQEMTEYRIFNPHEGRIPFNENPVNPDTLQNNNSNIVTE
ncbi:LPS export ABC transporter periplasmic protein LptC [Anaerorudis cellulosivorans]|uniref:LPS export ABC transporter periplasmic protein LptC n=1 Tax=Anaerorudis cellulosivorans TaxID=3397862 RepID=UPI00221FE32E|nr:LPS export ABC transporter periplasmic protein LptC [Seramator thermalis]MCW1735815.1 LPS export ABC transporter periplasmic protein LptC [Seramator thermalis]